MTEYETATLAIQEATLAVQQSALTLAYYSNLIALGVGVVQAVLIGWGIHYMGRMGEKREQQHAERHAEAMRTQADQHAETMEAFRQQAEAAKVQHAENMEALRQQGEAAKAQHTETMEASQAQHTETMEALRQQGEALRQQGEALQVIVERTAGEDRP